MADRYWVNDDADGLWNNANNWSASSGGAGGAGVPGAGDDVDFDGNGTDNCTLNVNGSANTITISAGYTGTFDTDTFNLSSGNFVADGGTITFGSGSHTLSDFFDIKDATSVDYETSDIDFSGTSTNSLTWCAGSINNMLYDVTISGVFTTNNVAYAAPRITNSLTVTGTLTNNASAGREIAIYAGSLSLPVGGTIAGTNKIIIEATTDSDASITDLGGTLSIATTELSVKETVNDINLVLGDYSASGVLATSTNGAAQADIVLAAGAYTFGNITVEAGLSVDCVFDNSANPTLTITGDVVANSHLGWTKGTGDITLSGTSNQSIDFNGESVEDIDMDKSNGTVTLTGNVTTDSLTLTDGTLDIDANNISCTGNLPMAAGTVCQDTTGGGTITVGGNLDINGINGTPCTWNGPDLTITGTADADWTTVTNSDASGGTEVDATDDCTDSGGNTNWDFGAGGEEHVKNLSDTINLSDARVFLFGVNKSDSVSLSELLAKNTGKPLTDTISMSDVTTKNVGLSESDSISMSDGITKAPGLPMADTITLSDNASMVASFLRSLNDTINLTDGAAKSFRTTKADTITMSDNLVSTIIAIIMNINDTINLSDGIVKNVSTARADTINLSDNFGKVIAYLRSFADTITLSDLGLREAGLNKADTVTLSDDVTKEPRLSKADTITLSDSIAKKLGLSRADTITLSDFFSSDAGIVWTNIIIKGIDIMSGEPVFITGKYRLP